jgi:hypothetical protein
VNVVVTGDVLVRGEPITDNTHTHTHNWLAVATATIEAGLLCVQEQHPVCVTATPSFLLSSSSLLCLCVSVLCC